MSIAVAALVAVAASGARASAPGRACERPLIGFMGPITGKAAFIGKEQLGFARYAVRTLGDGRIRLVEGDTQLDPKRAATVGAAFHRDARVLAVVGPAGSQEVLAVAPIFNGGARMPFVSGSAVRAALTNGSIPSFLRVVPRDSAQAPALARYIREVLKPKRVVVVDDRSSYSRPLAAGVQSRLRVRGVEVTRRSVSQLSLIHI